MSRRPTAFIQIDVDPLWAVRRAYGFGDDGGAAVSGAAPPDPVWDEAVPRFLEILSQEGARATFFALGQDALHPGRRRRLSEIIAAGHEVANHTFSHRLDLAVLPVAHIREEIARAQGALGEATGALPVGFRCPGYGMNDAVMEEARAAGFIYDSSVLPSPWGWAMRAIARRLSRRGPKDSSGPLQYGTVRGSWGPRRPYFPARRDFRLAASPGEEGNLIEIPVSVMPGLRLPFHGGIALALGMPYFRAGLWLHRLTTNCLNYVFHGVDLLDVRRHEIIPGAGGRYFFRHSLESRVFRAREMTRAILRTHEVVKTGQWAQGAQRAEGAQWAQGAQRRAQRAAGEGSPKNG